MTWPPPPTRDPSAFERSDAVGHDTFLDLLAATHLRGKGWTVEQPEPIEPRYIASTDALERHMEKQGCSWSDAWNYFRDQGYGVAHLDPFEA